MKTRAAVAFAPKKPLEIVELDLEGPRAGEVLVEIKATGICHTDAYTLDGFDSEGIFPSVLGHEGAGIVREVGAGVTSVKPGDHVALIFLTQCGECEHCIEGKPSLCTRGTQANREGRLLTGGPRLHLDGQTVHHHMGLSAFAEYALVSEKSLVKIPADLPFVEASLFGCAVMCGAGTALYSAGIRPGQTVLTQGTGGVSIFALQFAKMSGARVIATSSSEAKIEKLKALRADVTINYRTTPEWGKQVRQITGHGVDLVVEVGGVGTLNESIRATRIGGTIAFIGVLAGRPEQESRLPLMVMQQQRLQGVTVGSVEDLQAMADAIVANRMKPVVDKVFPFADAKAAFAHMASGAHFGKVAIAIS